MAPMNFIDQLAHAQRQNNSMLCVGLDPEPTKFPSRIKGDSNLLLQEPHGAISIRGAGQYKFSLLAGRAIGQVDATSRRKLYFHRSVQWYGDCTSPSAPRLLLL